MYRDYSNTQLKEFKKLKQMEIVEIDNALEWIADKKAEKIELDIRKSKQLTLGKLILELESIQRKDLAVYSQYGAKIVPISSMDSYKGKYEDLVIGVSDDLPTMTVGELLADAKRAKGRTFTGYGGDYLIDDDSFIWVSQYDVSSCLGLCGVEVIRLRVILKTTLM